MEKKFVCPVCGNDNPRYVERFKMVPYCSLCFCVEGRKLQRRSDSPQKVESLAPQTFLSLNYELSEEQKKLSDQVVENFVAGKNTLLYAVCGSGKTEVSYGVIDYALVHGLQAGFALPRRDVVIELYQRLKDAFPKKKVVAVYGGHQKELEGDIIILTTHQLHRYPKKFDLLVMDEVDAFPFAGNEELQRDYRNSLKGHCLMMSATPPMDLVREFNKEGNSILMMHTRFHQQPIPIPRPVYLHGPNKYQFLLDKVERYAQEEKPLFIFVPTIPQAESLFRVLSVKAPRGNYVTSKRLDREKVIEDFKNGKYDYLVTTAILERGVTVKNLNVIVFGAANGIYDAASLMQIAGRAGRKHDAPNGDVFFIADRETPAIRKVISEIRYCNTFLSRLSGQNRDE